VETLHTGSYSMKQKYTRSRPLPQARTRPVFETPADYFAELLRPLVLPYRAAAALCYTDYVNSNNR